MWQSDWTASSLFGLLQNTQNAHLTPPDLLSFKTPREINQTVRQNLEECNSISRYLRRDYD